jgi:hypothetical protein
MNKFVLIGLSLICLNSCTVYTEKQTEALSRNVYATKDSLDVARIDLADSYINEATKLVKPPKKRVSVNGVYQTPTETENKTRVVIVPEKYKGDKVVVVGSTDYDKLVQDKAIASQLKKDYETLDKVRQETDKELSKQLEYSSKMVRDLNTMQKKLVEKNLAILWRNIIIAVLGSILGLLVYLRFKGIALF